MSLVCGGVPRRGFRLVNDQLPCQAFSRVLRPKLKRRCIAPAWSGRRPPTLTHNLIWYDSVFDCTARRLCEMQGDIESELQGAQRGRQGKD